MVGEKNLFHVTDADQDVSDERDSVTLQIQHRIFGERNREMSENTGSQWSRSRGSVSTGCLDDPPRLITSIPNRQRIECYFGDKITATTAICMRSGSVPETFQSAVSVPVVVGTAAADAVQNVKRRDLSQSKQNFGSQKATLNSQKPQEPNAPERTTLDN